MLYTEGSPVIIEAGALQKDNVNGNIIAQLKFKSISAKVIKALTVKIVALDVSGNPIGEEIKHQYLDLTVQRNECFGPKEAIILSDNTTRAFSVFVTKIVFDDNTNIVLENLPFCFSLYFRQFVCFNIFLNTSLNRCNFVCVKIFLK